MSSESHEYNLHMRMYIHKLSAIRQALESRELSQLYQMFKETLQLVKCSNQA